MAVLREAGGGNALSEQGPREIGTPVQAGASEATSSAAQAVDAKEAAQAHKVRLCPLSPMWVAMSQRFKENVSALKSRQGRRPSMASRRQSLKRGPGPSQIEQPLAPRKGRVSIAGHISIAGRRQSLKRDSGAHISSRPLSSQDELPHALRMPEPQPLPSPEVARPQNRREEANQGGARRRNKRLRSKTPEPAEDRCQRPKRKRLSRKSSPSVESGCFLARPSSRDGCRSSRSAVRDAEQRKRPEAKQDHRSKRQSEGSTSRTHPVKAYRVTWAWKLAEMGFSGDQIDAAISQCSTQRQAIEWLCNSLSPD